MTYSHVLLIVYIAATIPAVGFLTIFAATSTLRSWTNPAVVPLIVLPGCVTVLCARAVYVIATRPTAVTEAQQAARDPVDQALGVGVIGLVAVAMWALLAAILISRKDRS